MPGDVKACHNCGFESRSGLHFCPKCGVNLGETRSHNESRNPYEVLQISKDAEAEVILAAYKSLAKKYHPDQNKSLQAEARMRDLNWAYDLLSDPIRRKAWDQDASRNRPQARRSQSFSQSAPRNSGQTHAKYSSTQRHPPKKSGSNVIGFLALVLVFVFLANLCGNFSQAGSQANSSANLNSGSFLGISSTATATRIPTSTPRPTISIQPITFLGNRCLHWSDVNKTHLGQKRCVYGRIYTFGPYLDRWDTIYFSAASSSFRVIDFNYYWMTPLELG